MEKKQSSIEWLENEIDFILKTYSYNSQDFHLNKAFEQAKAMRKEECTEIFKEAQECAVKHDGVYFKYNCLEDYYKSKECELESLPCELESLPCELESLSNIKQHEVTWIAALDYAIEKMKGLNNLESIDAFKQYYNQTYGGNNE